MLSGRGDPAKLHGLVNLVYNIFNGFDHML